MYFNADRNEGSLHGRCGYIRHGLNNDRFGQLYEPFNLLFRDFLSAEILDQVAFRISFLSHALAVHILQNFVRQDLGYIEDTVFIQPLFQKGMIESFVLCFHAGVPHSDDCILRMAFPLIGRHVIQTGIDGGNIVIVEADRVKLPGFQRNQLAGDRSIIFDGVHIEASREPFIVEGEPVDCSGVETVLHGRKLLRPVDMSQGNQIEGCRIEDCRFQYRLKLLDEASPA